MSQVTFFLILAVVVAAVVGISVLAYKRHKRRIAAFKQHAQNMGWTYRGWDDSLGGRFIGTPFGRGHSRRARHVFTGQHRGRWFVAFEYLYSETHSDGKNTTTTTYQNLVVGVSTPADRPTLEITKEGLGQRFLGAIGFKDLQLESEEFNRAFKIKAAQNKFAYDVLHPRMMEWMLADRRAIRFPFRFERSDLVTWERGTMDIGRLTWMLDYVSDVLDRVPQFVWSPV